MPPPHCRIDTPSIRIVAYASSPLPGRESGTPQRFVTSSCPLCSRKSQSDSMLPPGVSCLEQWLDRNA